MNLSHIIEAVIFVSDHPVSIAELLAVLNVQDDASQQNETPASDHINESEETKVEAKVELAVEKKYEKKEVQEALGGLLSKYEGDDFPFEIRKVAKGYQFFTKRTYHPWVKRASLEKNKKRLTKTAMETLAIIAYRQPVIKAELEFVRGVSCDYAIQKLLDKKLVSIVGRAESVGRPLLYAPSPYFMQYFGINGPEDLPQLREFEELMEDHMGQFRQYQVEGETPAQLTEGSEGLEEKIEDGENEIEAQESTAQAEEQEIEAQASEASEEESEEKENKIKDADRNTEASHTLAEEDEIEE